MIERSRYGRQGSRSLKMTNKRPEVRGGVMFLLQLWYKCTVQYSPEVYMLKEGKGNILWSKRAAGMVLFYLHVFFPFDSPCLIFILYALYDHRALSLTWKAQGGRVRCASLMRGGRAFLDNMNRYSTPPTLPLTVGVA
jgi:hypothetical protein